MERQYKEGGEKVRSEIMLAVSRDFTPRVGKL